MSILPDGMNPCGRKWFSSFEEATGEMRKTPNTRGPQYVLNVYHCYGCDGFHVAYTRAKGNQ